MRQDYQRAIEEFSKSISLEPRNGRTYYNRGQAYKSINNLEAAKRDFQQAAALGYSEAIRELGKP